VSFGRALQRFQLYRIELKNDQIFKGSVPGAIPYIFLFRFGAGFPWGRWPTPHCWMLYEIRAKRQRTRLSRVLLMSICGNGNPFPSLAWPSASAYIVITVPVSSGAFVSAASGSDSHIFTLNANHQTKNPYFDHLQVFWFCVSGVNGGFVQPWWVQFSQARWGSICPKLWNDL